MPGDMMRQREQGAGEHMPTGRDFSRVAKYTGEQYVFGAAVPKDHSTYRGPWDCAEFIFWVTYQVTKNFTDALITHAGLRQLMHILDTGRGTRIVKVYEHR